MDLYDADLLKNLAQVVLGMGFPNLKMYSRFTDEYYPKIAIESSFHYRYDVSSNEFLDGFLEHTLGKLPSREELHSKW